MSLAESSARTVIIGGGIQGLSLAYEMARLGAKDIVVLEKGYLCAGASGRNGGGVRAQWSSVEIIELMKESIEICRNFATEMRINVWFRQGGYLFLARTQERAEQLSRAVTLQNEHGVRTKLITPKEALEIVPELDGSRFVAASYNGDDGVVFPWPFVWGYARACRDLGVSVRTMTEVTGIEMENGRVTAVLTPGERIRTNTVVNATGAWSPAIGKMVGIDMPNKPHRHEICSTEPLKPFLRPLVADLGTGLYFSQSMRGEIVGGISNAEVPEGLDQESSLRFLGLYARSLTRTMPILGGVRVLRQWAGCYDNTPDGAPIIGRVSEVEGFYLLSGFIGYGFMLAPIMAKIAARNLVKDEAHPLFHKWSMSRFKEGRLLSEQMIIG